MRKCRKRVFTNISEYVSIIYICKHSDGESTYISHFTEIFPWLRGINENIWKMAPERRTEAKVAKAATGSACYSGKVFNRYLLRFVLRGTDE